MQRVDEMTEAPVVGRMYLVPCIVIAAADCAMEEKYLMRTWPVMGPVHEDRQLIGFQPLHVHIDPRFVTEREHGRGPYVLGRPLCFENHEGSSFLHGKPPPVTYRRRRCRREMPLWGEIAKVRGRTNPNGGLLPWTKALEAAFAGHRIKPDCRVCPHRGFPLGGLPVAEDGAVECPGHGLRWHHETGLLMPRVEVGNAA